MTNKEKFIEVFGENPKRHYVTIPWEDEEYVPPTAIEALKAQPCEDAISRADVKKYLSAPDANGDRVIYESDLDLLPPVTPKAKTGHWIEKEDYNLDIYYDCSECGESFCLIDGTPTDNLYNYCPNCGAKMEGEYEVSN